MGFSHAGLLCVCGRCSVCPRGAPYGLRTAALGGPHDNSAFHAAALHGNIHLLRKI